MGEGACLDGSRRRRGGAIVRTRRPQVDVVFRRFGIGWLKFPAPSSARGVLETTYLDEEMRISRGDKGNIFVLVRESIAQSE